MPPPSAAPAVNPHPAPAGEAAVSPPSLSVIVPNYNHAKYLDSSLPSILNQSYKPLEVIVLDDASTDNSVEVIRRIAAQNPLVRLVQNPQNLGVMPNLNKGVGLARGQYVFIGSADDEVMPGLFEASMRLLAQHPQAGLSCTVCEWRYTDSGLSFYMAVGMADQPAYLSPDDLVRLGHKGKLIISSSSVIFRREALENVGLFLPELRWHADWFAAFMAAFRFGLCYVPETLSIVNILPRSFYTAGRKRPEHLQVLTRILELISSPAFTDVRPRIRASGALSLFAVPLLKILFRRREFWPLCNLTLLYRTARRESELLGKKVLPTWLARWVLRRFYGRN